MPKLTRRRLLCATAPLAAAPLGMKLALDASAEAAPHTAHGGHAEHRLSPLFFAIAAGAALQVVVEVGRYVARTAPGGLRSGWAMGGFVAGIAAMWATGLLAG